MLASFKLVALWATAIQASIMVRGAANDTVGEAHDDDTPMTVMGPFPAYPFDPDTSLYCQWWYDNSDNSISCEDFPVIFDLTVAEFQRWNPILKGSCAAWVPETSWCINADGEPPVTPIAPPTTKPTSTTTTTTRAATTTTPGNGITTPTPTQSGMAKNCNKFHQIKTTTTCQGIVEYNKITLSDFLKWNPGVGSNCQSLWLDTYACVGVNGGTTTTKPPATTTQPGNGVTTPTPTQSGMATNCNKFHLIKTTTTCQGIVDYNKITLANFLKWNPAVGSNCQNLWLNTYACVGLIGGTTTTAKPTTTTKAPGNGISTPTPTQSGMVTNCNKFHHVRPTTTCQGILDYNKISLANFSKWNPAVGATCGGLWANTYACVGVVGGGTTTSPGNGIATPTPTQAGMVTNCKKFHHVRPTTTCQGILDYNKITLANFFRWNPAVGSSCGNLWANTYACVGV